MRRKKKPIFKVNNNLKEFGNEQDGKIEVNVKKHQGNRSELADTVRHELNHMKNPKASEKKIIKKTKIDMSKMSWGEKEALIKKVRNKKMNYKGGALKRKFKMGRTKVEPGEYISAMNKSKVSKKTNPARTSGFKLGVQALI